MKTLGEFIVDKQHEFSEAKGDLSALLSAIKLGAQIINRDINKAGLVDILGANGVTNTQGEAQTKLDLFANEKLKAALQARGEVAGIASEEDDDIIIFKERAKSGKYVVLMDPLDGSSNIDVNVSVGTIFSIYKRITPIDEPVTLADFLQPGINQVAAGYVVYGSSTMLVYTTGYGVHAFTYDPSLGVFCLSHEKERVEYPPGGCMYSINEGNYIKFPLGVKKYIKYCQEEDKETQRPYSSRYIGSLVADFHRNLLKGGIYIYPSTAAHPQGKLRLLYECNPMAFLAEQAGGKASDGKERILSIVPKELHQRSPLFVGTRSMVEKAESFMVCDQNNLNDKETEMSLKEVPAGKSLPEDIYVVIEIPANADPIKYEVDKESGALFVDRFMSTAMFYPCNYGYINHTLSLDGDPVDVLVPTPYPLQPGSVIRCRPVGMLKMSDESGEDAKLVAVPHTKLSTEYDRIKDVEDLPGLLKSQIIHFFKHYKDLEAGKWVKIEGWQDATAARAEICTSYERYKLDKK